MSANCPHDGTCFVQSFCAIIKLPKKEGTPDQIWGAFWQFPVEGDSYEKAS